MGNRSSTAPAVDAKASAKMTSRRVLMLVSLESVHIFCRRLLETPCCESPDPLGRNGYRQTSCPPPCKSSPVFHEVRDLFSPLGHDGVVSSEPDGVDDDEPIRILLIEATLNVHAREVLVIE